MAAIAFKLMFGRISASGIDLQAGCKTIPDYTGFSKLDQALCPLINFFALIMHSSDGFAFLTYISGIGLPFLLLPLFEAYRPGQNKLLRHPVIWLLLGQFVTVAVAFPLYWLTFILRGGPQRTQKSSAKLYTQADAEALVFGIIVGVIIPSVAMLKMDDPIVTALWQIYPIFIVIAESVHLFFRPPSRYPQSGFITLLVLFTASFIVASSVHVATIWPLVNNLQRFNEVFLPSLHPLPSSAPATAHYLEVLKWDIIFSNSSSVIATFWFAENIKQLLLIGLWYIFAIPVLGFGAAVAGVALWRNGFL